MSVAIHTYGLLKAERDAPEIKEFIDGIEAVYAVAERSQGFMDQLKKEKIKLADPADKATLARRAALTLTGLPLQPAQVRGLPVGRHAHAGNPPLVAADTREPLPASGPSRVRNGHRGLPDPQ